MSMDFGFGGSDPSSSVPYTTLASSQFMTFADSFDSPPSMSNGTPVINPFNFDMQSLASWPTPSQQQQQVGGNVRMQNSEPLDGLFGGHYMDTGGPVDINALLQSPPSTLSPVIHANVASATSGSSPASNLSLFNTPRDSSASEEDHNEEPCPKTKEEAARRIASQGLSSFAPAPSPAPMLRKGSDGLFGSMVTCKGANFPSTEKNDQNIEVLSAWRSITSKFKDADVNDLCAEFTKKARCDGTKVVLEPQGVNSILETLESKKR
jgi:AP-1-like factor